jgi:hypothetical protein
VGGGEQVTWPVIRDQVERDPLPFALALGIGLPSVPEKPRKTMAQIFTSPGKGPRKESPIGFEGKKPYRVSDHPKTQTLGLCRISSTDRTPLPPLLSSGQAGGRSRASTQAARIDLAREAQQAGINRHSWKPAPRPEPQGPAVTEDGWTRERENTQDLSAWEPL